MPKLVTIGETMVVLYADKYGPLRYVNTFERQTGGAATNVAVAVYRLGHSAGWISKLGNDEFGKYIYSLFKGEGLDVQEVKFDDKYPTGVFFKETKANSQGRNFYYRNNSAASHLDSKDINEEYIKNADVLHISGITLYLSETSKEATLKAIKIAKKNNVVVTFDPNIRLKISSLEEARQNTFEVAKYVDYFLPSFEELSILLNLDELNKISKQLIDMGINKSIIKLGEKGAYLSTTKCSEHISGYSVDNIVDSRGAGDAFSGGFIAGLLDGLSIKDAIKQGNKVGAMAITVSGNIEALPEKHELDLHFSHDKKLNR
jgi:2-dehydro-3-deoxygluconokinase